MTGGGHYEPFDQETKLGLPPWRKSPELDEWQEAHGHDPRTKCYPEYGCRAIEAVLERCQAAVEEVRFMHRTDVDVCVECGVSWPCPTIRVLDGDTP